MELNKSVRGLEESLKELKKVNQNHKETKVYYSLFGQEFNKELNRYEVSNVRVKEVTTQEALEIAQRLEERDLVDWEARFMFTVNELNTYCTI